MINGFYRPTRNTYIKLITRMDILRKKVSREPRKYWWEMPQKFRELYKKVKKKSKIIYFLHFNKGNKVLASDIDYYS